MAEKKGMQMNPQQLAEAYRGERTKMERLQQRQQALQNALGEIVTAKEAIKELREAKEGETVMVSLGAGVYAEAKAGKTKNVKSSLAGNILREEDSKTAEKRLDGEKESLKKSMGETSKQLQATAQNLRNFEKVFSQIRQRAQPQGQGKQQGGARSVS